MPLRDHFRPSPHNRRGWHGLFGQWPAMMVIALSGKLPTRYTASPRIQLAGSREIEFPTGEQGDADHVVWIPNAPSLSSATDLPLSAEYEVRVYDEERGRRLAAAVEVVSPANKDRPEHRHAFVAKCVALLQQRVSVAIVDLVTTRQFNLYAELLGMIGQTDPSLAPEPPHTYAAALRTTKQGEAGLLEAWAHPLVIGQPLPTLPLWLTDNLAIPLELEESYEETCRILRIA